MKITGLNHVPAALTQVFIAQEVGWASETVWKWQSNKQQDKQSNCDVTLRRVGATAVAGEKQ